MRMGWFLEGAVDSLSPIGTPKPISERPRWPPSDRCHSERSAIVGNGRRETGKGETAEHRHSAVIPSGAPQARRRGIAIIPEEGPGIGVRPTADADYADARTQIPQQQQERRR